MRYLNYKTFEAFPDELESGIPKKLWGLLEIEGVGRERAIKLSDKAAATEKEMIELEFLDILSIEGIGEKIAIKIIQSLRAC